MCHNRCAAIVNLVCNVADCLLHAREKVRKLLTTRSRERRILIQPALREGRVSRDHLLPRQPLPIAKRQLS